MATYFIFDMDQTLADPLPVFYFISALRLNTTADNIISAYINFVKDILVKETGEKPLGILRPGILPVMNKLNELQEKGKIKSVIIYSNNGHLETIEFIRDLIHLYVGNTRLISDCIHWHHPLRNEERIVRPGVPNKTWRVLKNIMREGNCKAPPTLAPQDIYFFDDLDHQDLQHNLGPNYYKVPPYDFKASVDRIAEIYRNSIKDIDIEEYIELLNANKFRFNTNTTIDDIIEIIKNKTKGTVSADTLPPPPDKGITQIMDAINRVETPVKGGYYRRKKTYKKKTGRCCSRLCLKSRRRRKN
jgi:hypothetical protein